MAAAREGSAASEDLAQARLAESPRDRSVGFDLLDAHLLFRLSNSGLYQPAVIPTRLGFPNQL